MISYSLFLNRFTQKTRVLALLAALLPGGCGVIYVPDVQQGNLITAENISRIKQGMTAQQVRFVLGTPLIQDPFHKDRWDYHYSYRSGETGEVEIQRATIMFRNGKVDKITKNLSPVKKEANK